MCDRETPRAERAMCACYTRRSVIGVGLAVVVVGLAKFAPGFITIAFVTAFVAAIAIVGLAFRRGADEVFMLHRYTPARAPQPAAESSPTGWWETSRATWPPKEDERPRPSPSPRAPSTAHWN